MERRASERVPVGLEVCLDAETAPVSCTLNLSEGGLLLKTDSRPLVGTEVDLKVLVPGHEAPILVRARVVRLATDGLAVQFIGEMGPKVLRLLKVSAAR
jgi:hypothetical protein